MCLAIKAGIEIAFDDEGWGTFYKSMGADWVSTYKGFRYRPGQTYHSNRPSKELTPEEAERQVILQGVHVFLKENDAHNDALDNSIDDQKDYLVIEVRAHRDDLIGIGSFCGNHSAAFMKVEISEDCVLRTIYYEEDNYDDDD